MARLSVRYRTCIPQSPTHLFYLVLITALLALFLDPVNAAESGTGKDAVVEDEAPLAEMDESAVREIIGEDVLDQLDKETQKYMKDHLDEIQRERRSLEVLRGELDQRIDKLSRLQKDLDQRLAIEDKQNQERIQNLVKIYQGMKPEQISALLWKLDEDIRYQVLERLKNKTISKILTLIPPEQAAEVTRRLLREGKM